MEPDFIFIKQRFNFAGCSAVIWNCPVSGRYLNPIGVLSFFFFQSGDFFFVDLILVDMFFVVLGFTFDAGFGVVSESVGGEL